MSTTVSCMKGRPLPPLPPDTDGWIPHPRSMPIQQKFILSGLNDYVPVNTNPRDVPVVEEDSLYELTSIYGGAKRTYAIPSQTKTVPSDNASIAKTISGITTRFLTTNQPFLRPCPIGLTDVEKEKFCTYMEFSHASLLEGGWKDLVERLIALNDEDLTLIETFCGKSNIPVMEIVLEHWNLLHNLRSEKCLLVPSKSVLVMVLKEMRRQDILCNMQWMDTTE